MLATMYNSSGFSKKVVQPSSIMKLPLIDKQVKTINKSIRRVPKEFIERALKLLNN